MIGYIIKLATNTGIKLEAMCSLDRHVAHIVWDSKDWDGQALAQVIWTLLKQAGLRLRLGAEGYVYRREDHRMLAWKNGDAVGWANVTHNRIEINGSLECLMAWAIQHGCYAPDNNIWFTEDVAVMQNQRDDFKTMNLLLEFGACELGGQVPQFLVAPGQPWIPQMDTEVGREWLHKSGAHEHLLSYHSTYETYVLEMERVKTEENEAKRQAREDADEDIPDWLRGISQIDTPSEPARIVGGAFDGMVDIED